MTLNEFFKEHPKVALGFSGGTDSSFLLWAAVNAGADVAAYYAQSVFQPRFEQEDALRLCGQLRVQLRIIPLDVLSFPQVAQNDERRCYYCKQQVFGALARRAAADGYTVIIDGTNASDDAAERPGFAALAELQVLSPLRACGITKAQVRQLSRQAGLFTADKPSYACLATRVWEHPLTAESLQRAEQAENEMFRLGYRNFRVRCKNSTALVQIGQMQYAKARQNWDEIHTALRKYFDTVTLDETPRSEEC